MDTKARRAQWTETVAKWRESGDSKAAFCRREGIPEWKFHYWFSRLASPPAAGFARVTAATGTDDDSGLRLRLPSGLELLIGREFDEATLARVLTAAVRAC
jgi:hypothetical protein